MKINDILECFNRHLDSKVNGNSIHFVASSKWEKKFGALKKATTSIFKISPDSSEEIITKEYATNIPSGAEAVLMEHTERLAIKEFIDYYYNLLVSYDS